MRRFPIGLTLLLVAIIAGAASPVTGQGGDPLFANQWGLNQINAPEAWSVSQGGGSIVAVVDTGADFGHPDLSGRLEKGRDVIEQDDNPSDDHQEADGSCCHGTHVSGIIAANRNNGMGIAGVAPQAKVLVVKALDSEGRASSGEVVAAIRDAVDRGAHIINLSLGDLLEGTGVLESEAVDNAILDAARAGRVVVAAAGNNGYPFADASTSNSVLIVGATDRDDTRADYSNAGPGVNIWAPGGEGQVSIDQFFCSSHSSVWSTVRRGLGDCADDYDQFRGTSMAAPHVAGIAALVRSTNPNLSSVQIRQIILDSSDTIPGGLKRVNAENAVAKAKSTAPSGGGSSPTGRGGGKTSSPKITAHAASSTPGSSTAAASPQEESPDPTTAGAEPPDEEGRSPLSIFALVALAAVAGAATFVWFRLRRSPG